MRSEGDIMFKKQFFSPAVIKAIANNKTVYERGQALSEEESSFQHVEVDADSRSVALTINDDKTKEQKVEMSFLKNGIASTYSCSCKAFEQYADACEHVVASMFYLNHYSIEELMQQQKADHLLGDTTDTDQTNEKLLDQLLHTHYQLEYNHKTTLRFEYVLNLNPLPRQSVEAGLYMRVGLNYLYVVHDFSTVLRFLTHERAYQFGKQLTYQPDEHAIAASDRQLLQKLNEIDQMRAVYQEDETSYENDKPPFLIPAPFVKDILELMHHTQSGYVRWGYPPNKPSEIDPNELAPAVIFEEEKMPLEVSIIKTDEHYTVNIQAQSSDIFISFLEGTPLLSINHKIWYIPPQDKPLFERLLTVFEVLNEHELHLNRSQLSEFLSIYLKIIKKYFHFEMDETIYEHLKETNFQTKIYIDYYEGSLYIDPVFMYGSNEVHPLSHKKDVLKEALVIRNFAEEETVLQEIARFFHAMKLTKKGWAIQGDEAISRFLYEDLQDLDEEYPIYLSNQVKKLIYRPNQKPAIYMEHNEKTNLLDVSFELEDVSPHDLQQMIQAIEADQRFYRLDSGQLVDLHDEEIDAVAQAIHSLGLCDEDLKKEQVSVQLAKGLGLENHDLIKQGQHFQELLEQLEHPDTLSFEIPKSLHASLRDYQKTGFKWLKTMAHYGFGAVLADDMGLGKTIQAITFILSQREEIGGKYLVICPSSVMYNWESEFSRFAPTLKTQLITGSAYERQEKLKMAMADKATSVLISSYPLIHRDIALFSNYSFETIVLDESQNIKNIDTKTSQAIKQLQTKNIIALSGTPIENNLNELWALFSTVQPGLFKSHEDFVALSNEEISKKIHLFILRRLKEEVLDDLPPKVETEQFIELAEEQKRMYQTQLALIKRDVNQMIDEETFEKHRIEVLAGLTRLRQICNDPRLVQPDYKGSSAKFERLFEFLEEARQNNKRVVLFSQFTSMLTLIRQVLDEKAWDYHYLDGQTPKENRLELTERFNQGEKDLFLISLKAGGVGLNLIGGDTVILYDSWWNPAVEDQATDRVHRIGQQNPVQVLRLICKGTIEEGIFDLQKQKRELIDSIMQTDQELSINKLSKEDILQLLQ